MTCDGQGHRFVDCCAFGAIRLLIVPEGEGATHLRRADGEQHLRVCECCFKHEIEWRADQNRMLIASGKFALPTWEEASLVDMQLRVPHRYAGRTINLAGRHDGERCTVQDWASNAVGHCIHALPEDDPIRCDFSSRYGLNRDAFLVSMGVTDTLPEVADKTRNAVLVSFADGKQAVLLNEDLQGAVPL